MLTNGTYRTQHGSIVEVSGRHHGIHAIRFDWVEEERACIDCQPYLHDDELHWECAHCGGGWAELKKVEE